jgi:hypothetical protein
VLGLPDREVGSWFVGSDEAALIVPLNPCREPRREQAIAMTRKAIPFVRLSGAGMFCRSIFENLRCAFWKGNPRRHCGSCLTSCEKFDTFGKFAQKCWRTQSRAFFEIPQAFACRMQIRSRVTAGVIELLGFGGYDLSKCDRTTKTSSASSSRTVGLLVRASIPRGSAQADSPEGSLTIRLNMPVVRSDQVWLDSSHKVRCLGLTGLETRPTLR